MQKYHVYSIYYTRDGIAYSMSFIFAPNRQEALARAKKYLEDDGTKYDEGSLEAKREWRFWRSMVDY